MTPFYPRGMQVAFLAQTLFGVLSKIWEAILHSLHVWDLPWALTGPPNSSRRAAPPQLPQPLACLAQECKGGRETDGRGSTSGSCSVPRSGGSPNLPEPSLLGVLEGLGLCPSLPRFLELGTFIFPAKPSHLCSGQSSTTAFCRPLP